MVNENRARIRAGWFSVTSPDDNHDFYGLVFTTKDYKQDIIIEIEDIRKLACTLGDHIWDYVKSSEMHSELTKKQLVELSVYRLGTINTLREELRNLKRESKEE